MIVTPSTLAISHGKPDAFAWVSRANAGFQPNRARSFVTAMSALAFAVCLLASRENAAAQGLEIPTGGAVEKPPTPPKTGLADRYGDALPSGAIVRLGTERFRHAGSIYSMAYSADGRLLVTGNAGGGRISNLVASVVVWDVETGKRIRTWSGHAHVVRCVTFSPDNKLLAVVNGYGKLVVYDVASGKEPRRYAIEHPVMAVFTPDGSTLLVTEGQNVRRWRLATGEELEPLRAAERIDTGVAVARDGKTIVTSGRDGTVRVWESDGRERRTFRIPTKTLYFTGLSPDGRRLVCTVAEKEGLQLWDTSTGRNIWDAPNSEVRIWGQQPFSPDGKSFVTVGGRKLTWWDTETGKSLRSVDEPNGSAYIAAFSPDGHRIATAGDDAGPLFWDPHTGKETTRFEGHFHAVESAVFAPDGKTLAAVAGERFVHLWDLATGEARPFGSSPQPIRSAAIAPDGKTMVTTSPRSWPIQWDLSTGKQLRRFESKDRDAGGGVALFSADGKTLAAATQNSRIRFWDVATGEEFPVMVSGQIDWMRNPSSNGNFLKFAFAPDGKSVATTLSESPASGVMRWDLATGEKRPRDVDSNAVVIRQQLSESPHKKRPLLADHGEPAAFSPDSRLVAILDGKAVRLVNAATGQLLRRIAADAQLVTCAAFSPDGKTIATAGEEKTIALWETATGERRDLLPGHAKRVNFVTFASDGRRLASGGEDHTALIWNLAHSAGATPISDQECDASWASLAGSDAAKAYRAIWALSADPDRSVPFLKARLQPIAPLDAKRIVHLLSELKSERFVAREKATQELEKLAERAIPALRQALAENGDLEFRRRVERLLLADAETQPPPPEQLRMLRSIETLEHAATADAQALLRSLAEGSPESRVTQDANAALARLSRPATQQKNSKRS